MINLRYHIFSLAAVLLALAAGVALGAGVLYTGETPDSEIGQQKAISPALAGFDAGFATLTAPDLIENELKGRTVVVMTMPSAREGEVGGIVENLTLAGADVVGQIQLTSKFLAPGNRQFVEGVARQSLTDAPSTAGAYEIIGTALARAYLTKDKDKLDESARTIRAAFSEGRLVDPVKDPNKRAELAVIIAGPTLTADEGEGGVMAQIVGTLDSQAKGTVVAGPVVSGEDGVVRSVRQSEAASSVTTVDVTDTGTGRIVVVLGLIREADGRGGAWGTSRAADGPVPN